MRTHSVPFDSFAYRDLNEELLIASECFYRCIRWAKDISDYASTGSLEEPFHPPIFDDEEDGCLPSPIGSITYPHNVVTRPRMNMLTSSVSQRRNPSQQQSASNVFAVQPMGLAALAARRNEAGFEYSTNVTQPNRRWRTMPLLSSQGDTPEDTLALTSPLPSDFWDSSDDDSDVDICLAASAEALDTNTSTPSSAETADMSSSSRPSSASRFACMKQAASRLLKLPKKIANKFQRKPQAVVQVRRRSRLSDAGSELGDDRMPSGRSACSLRRRRCRRPCCTRRSRNPFSLSPPSDPEAAAREYYCW